MIETERLVLRVPPVSEAAAVAAYQGRNREHFAASSPRRTDAFFEVAFWQEELARAIEEWDRKASLRLFIWRKSDPSRVIGHVAFTNIVGGPFQACFLGYGLDHADVSAGYMTEALRAALGWVFRELPIHRVMANNVPTNERSAKVLRRLGFVPEGARARLPLPRRSVARPRPHLAPRPGHTVMTSFEAFRSDLETPSGQ